MKRFAFALLAFSIPCVLHGEPPAPRKIVSPVPFRCFAQVWNDSFKQVSISYDKDNHQAVVTLVANKDVSILTYEAELSDGEGTIEAVVPVRFEPNYTQFKKGAKVRALIPFGDLPIVDIARVRVRVRN